MFKLQMLKISDYITQIANKKEEDEGSLIELQKLFNMRLCDIKPPPLDLPQGSSRKRTYDPQPKSMNFPRSSKRRRPHKSRLDGTLSEIQKGLAHEPKHREW